jgi:hypothetical protein
VGKGGTDVAEHFVFMENSLGYFCHCEYVLEQMPFINLIWLKMSLVSMRSVGRMVHPVYGLLTRLRTGRRETWCLNSGQENIFVVATVSKPDLGPSKPAIQRLVGPFYLGHSVTNVIFFCVQEWSGGDHIIGWNTDPHFIIQYATGRVIFLQINRPRCDAKTLLQPLVES